MRRPAPRSVVRLVAAGAATATLLTGVAACGDDGDDDTSSESTGDAGVVEREDSEAPATEGGDGETEDDGLDEIEVNDDLGPDFPIDEIPVIDGENSLLTEAGGWLVTVDFEGGDLDAIYEAAGSLLDGAGFERGNETGNSGNWTSTDWGVELVTYPSETDGYVTVQYGITPN